MDHLDEIAKLINQVPRPPEDSIPPGVSTSDIDEFESRTGMTLPVMLRRWLSVTNGPCIGPGGFYGIHPLRTHLDIEECLRRFPEWIARQWIPVAGDGCGNHYVVPTRNEFGPGYPVLFVDVGQGSTSASYIVASDLDHFIVATLRKELEAVRWPFDQEEVLSFDPRITDYHGVALPWSEVTK